MKQAIVWIVVFSSILMARCEETQGWIRSICFDKDKPYDINESYEFRITLNHPGFLYIVQSIGDEHTLVYPPDRVRLKKALEYFDKNKIDIPRTTCLRENFLEAGKTYVFPPRGCEVYDYASDGTELDSNRETYLVYVSRDTLSDDELNQIFPKMDGLYRSGHQVTKKLQSGFPKSVYVPVDTTRVLTNSQNEVKLSKWHRNHQESQVNKLLILDSPELHLHQQTDVWVMAPRDGYLYLAGREAAGNIQLLRSPSGKVKPNEHIHLSVPMENNKITELLLLFSDKKVMDNFETHVIASEKVSIRE